MTLHKKAATPEQRRELEHAIQPLLDALASRILILRQHEDIIHNSPHSQTLNVSGTTPRTKLQHWLESLSLQHRASVLCIPPSTCSRLLLSMLARDTESLRPCEFTLLDSSPEHIQPPIPITAKPKPNKNKNSKTNKNKRRRSAQESDIRLPLPEYARRTPKLHIRLGSQVELQLNIEHQSARASRLLLGHLRVVHNTSSTAVEATDRSVGIGKSTTATPTEQPACLTLSSTVLHDPNYLFELLDQISFGHFLRDLSDSAPKWFIPDAWFRLGAYFASAIETRLCAFWNHHVSTANNPYLPPLIEPIQQAFNALRFWTSLDIQDRCKRIKRLHGFKNVGGALRDCQVSIVEQVKSTHVDIPDASSSLSEKLLRAAADAGVRVDLRLLAEVHRMTTGASPSTATTAMTAMKTQSNGKLAMSLRSIPGLSKWINRLDADGLDGIERANAEMVGSQASLRVVMSLADMGTVLVDQGFEMCSGIVDALLQIPSFDSGTCVRHMMCMLGDLLICGWKEHAFDELMSIEAMDKNDLEATKHVEEANVKRSMSRTEKRNSRRKQHRSKVVAPVRIPQHKALETAKPPVQSWPRPPATQSIARAIPTPPPLARKKRERTKPIVKRLHRVATLVARSGFEAAKKKMAQYDTSEQATIENGYYLEDDQQQYEQHRVGNESTYGSGGVSGWDAAVGGHFDSGLSMLQSTRRLEQHGFQNDINRSEEVSRYEPYSEYSNLFADLGDSLFSWEVTSPQYDTLDYHDHHYQQPQKQYTPSYNHQDNDHQLAAQRMEGLFLGNDHIWGANDEDGADENLMTSARGGERTRRRLANNDYRGNGSLNGSIGNNTSSVMFGSIGPRGGLNGPTNSPAPMMRDGFTCMASSNTLFARSGQRSDVSTQTDVNELALMGGGGWRCVNKSLSSRGRKSTGSSSYVRTAQTACQTADSDIGGNDESIVESASRRKDELEARTGASTRARASKSCTDVLMETSSVSSADSMSSRESEDTVPDTVGGGHSDQREPEENDDEEELPQSAAAAAAAAASAVASASNMSANTANVVPNADRNNEDVGSDNESSWTVIRKHSNRRRSRSMGKRTLQTPPNSARSETSQRTQHSSANASGHGAGRSWYAASVSDAPRGRGPGGGSVRNRYAVSVSGDSSVDLRVSRNSSATITQNTTLRFPTNHSNNIFNRPNNDPGKTKTRLSLPVQTAFAEGTRFKNHQAMHNRQGQCTHRDSQLSQSRKGVYQQQPSRASSPSSVKSEHGTSATCFPPQLNSSASSDAINLNKNDLEGRTNFNKNRSDGRSLRRTGTPGMSNHTSPNLLSTPSRRQQGRKRQSLQPTAPPVWTGKGRNRGTSVGGGGGRRIGNGGNNEGIGGSNEEQRRQSIGIRSVAGTSTTTTPARTVKRVDSSEAGAMGSSRGSHSGATSAHRARAIAMAAPSITISIHELRGLLIRVKAVETTNERLTETLEHVRGSLRTLQASQARLERVVVRSPTLAPTTPNADQSNDENQQQRRRHGSEGGGGNVTVIPPNMVAPTRAASGPGTSSPVVVGTVPPTFSPQVAPWNYPTPNPHHGYALYHQEHHYAAGLLSIQPWQMPAAHTLIPFHAVQQTPHEWHGREYSVYHTETSHHPPRHPPPAPPSSWRSAAELATSSSSTTLPSVTATHNTTFTQAQLQHQDCPASVVAPHVASVEDFPGLSQSQHQSHQQRHYRHQLRQKQVSLPPYQQSKPHAAVHSPSTPARLASATTAAAAAVEGGAKPTPSNSTSTPASTSTFTSQRRRLQAESGAYIPPHRMTRSASSTTLATATGTVRHTATSGSSEHGAHSRHRLKADSGEYIPHPQKTRHEHEANRRQEAIMHANPLLLHQPHVFPLRHLSGGGTLARRVSTDGAMGRNESIQIDSYASSMQAEHASGLDMHIGATRACGPALEGYGKAHDNDEEKRFACGEQTDWEEEVEGDVNTMDGVDVKEVDVKTRGHDVSLGLVVAATTQADGGNGGELDTSIGSVMQRERQQPQPPPPPQQQQQHSPRSLSDAVSEPEYSSAAHAINGKGRNGEWMMPGEPAGTVAAEWPRDDYAYGTRLRPSRFRSSGNLAQESQRQQERMTQLSNDVLRFMNVVVARQQSRKRSESDVVQRLVSVVKQLWPRGVVKQFGSCVTGLALPSGDMDLVICLPKVMTDSIAEAPGLLEGRNAIKLTWQQNLAGALQLTDWIDKETLKVISNSPMPIITCSTVGPPLHNESVRLDISFEAENHHGLATNWVVQSLQAELPELRPMVLVLKQFLSERGLSKGYTGGLSSYGLLLMVACFLRSQQPHIQIEPLPFNQHTEPALSRCRRQNDNMNRPRSSSMDSGSCACVGLGYGVHFHVSECERSTWGSARLGNLLLGFLHKFGSLNASLTGISLATDLFDRRSGRDPNQFDPLYIEDPLQPENNVGRNCFRIAIIQKHFLESAKTLERYISQNNVNINKSDSRSRARNIDLKGTDSTGNIREGSTKSSSLHPRGYLASILYCISESDPTFTRNSNNSQPSVGQSGNSGDTELVNRAHPRNTSSTSTGILNRSAHQRNYRDAVTSSLGTGHALLLAHMNVHEQVRASPEHWQHASASATTSPPYGQGRSSVTEGSADLVRRNIRVVTESENAQRRSVGQTVVLRKDTRSMSTLL